MAAGVTACLPAGVLGPDGLCVFLGGLVAAFLLDLAGGLQACALTEAVKQGAALLDSAGRQSFGSAL